MSVFLTPIYTQTAGAGGVSSITFNNIPQGFTDLKLVVSGRTNQLASAGGYAGIVRLNSMTTNVSGNQVYGDGTAIGANRWDAIYINVSASDYTANTFGTAEVYIPNYTRGTFKQVQVDTNSENNGAGAPIGQASVSWGSTAPVTTVTILPYIGNFVQYSTFTLYGVANVYDTAAPAAPTIGAVTDLGGIASVAFTANDSGQGRTADNYSVQDMTIMAAPVYAQNSPVIVPVTTGVTYNGLAVSANNSVGSNASANPSGFTSQNNYASIATATAPNANASVYSFTNIPQYYKHLQLRCRTRGAGAGNAAYFIVNMIAYSGNSYQFQAVEAEGAVVRAINGNPANGFTQFFMSANNQDSNLFGGFVIDFINYTSTSKFKSARGIGGFSSNTNTGGQDYGLIGLNAGTIPIFEPIVTIQVGAYMNFSANSTFALYGVS